MRRLILCLILGLVSLVGVRLVAASPDRIACPPGQITMLTGTGIARSGILLSWNGRIIGGGVIRVDGTWQLPLQPAADAPSGEYLVAVTARDSGRLVGSWTCQVVNTRLPTPGRRMDVAVSPTATPMPTVHRMVPPTTLPATPEGTLQPTAVATAAATATPLPTGTASPTAAPPTAACPTVCIVASDITTADAPGYLVMQNDRNVATDLSGWVLRAGDARLTLTATLAPGAVLLIYGMAGDDEPGTVYWPGAAFAPGDSITVIDAAGVVQQQWTLATRMSSGTAARNAPRHIPPPHEDVRSAGALRGAGGVVSMGRV